MMVARRAVVIIALAVLGAPPAGAQEADYSGVWVLAPDQGRVDPAAGMTGLIPAGAPDVLHVSQSANGTVSVESQINESHSRFYVPGRESSTAAGPSGAIVMTSVWDGLRLISEGRIESRGAPVPVREVFSISPDGQALTIEVTLTAEGSESFGRFVYDRSERLESCDRWPTPCASQ